MEMVGHVYIKETMAKDENICFAGEASGHYFFRKNWNADSGVIAFIILLESICLSGKKPSELRKEYEPYASLTETNFRVSDVKMKIAELKERYANGTQSTFDGLTVRYPDWWFNVRPSSNEPLLRLNLEAKDRAMLEAKFQELQAFFA